MSETRRPVTVDVVYDGEHCSTECRFLEGSQRLNQYCWRFHSIGLVSDGESAVRCNECKAEDQSAKSVYPIVDGPPKDTSCFVEMSEEGTRELNRIFAPGRIVKVEYPKE